MTDRMTFGSPRPPRNLAPEVPVALVYDGATMAVMMASPMDAVDFAYGFSLSEGICAAEDISEVDPHEVEGGLDLRIWLRPGAQMRQTLARQMRPGPVGCGICGRESLAEALRDLPVLPALDFSLSAEGVLQAVRALPALQTYHQATRAMHAAAFWNGERLIALREDVGRHNALDKLAGALARAGTDLSQGAVVMTSRISVDLVQKAAALRVPVLIGLSAATEGAVRRAAALGLTLIANAGPEGFDLFSAPERVKGELSHVS
ncbi:formate dehydrogenase accessory sulfurtransferase FdhD [Falsigemmobacter intermedius]|uniref:formate dehydrogenase accessory sulfurtransferase FdhD n=1 Tax=Falsigemmobacter intermedius TaxID=1553448 RepID=UPI003F111F0C